MARSHYTEYVNHCMRFYTRHAKPVGQSTDALNWLSCEKALATFSPADREILTFVYRERDTISYNVYTIAKEKGIKQNRVWDMMTTLELKIAKIRGLI